MAGLSVGTIPSYYREVYDVVCPDGSSGSRKVEKEVWVRCMKTASLPSKVIDQIWEDCDPSGSGSLSRDSLYRSLALSALAQQGKAVDEKSLQHYGDAELPIPKLANFSELRELSMRVLRVTRPTELGYTYEELKSLDDIGVSIVPEKQGMVFKHVEYFVESKNFKSRVQRRYRDFEAFYDVLVSKYPYRLVPRLPPKKFTPSSAYIEQRRRALKRFTILVVRHPIFHQDEIVRFFLTAGAPEVGSRLKEKFKNTKDEFLFSPHAKNAEALVSESTRVKYERIQEQISVMHHVVSSMLQVAHNMEGRSQAMEADMKQLAANMNTLATDTHLMSSWTSGTDETWSYLQRDFGSMHGKFGSLFDKSRQQFRRETSGFTESVHLYLDLITSYQDLCERREKLVHKHQKALAKVQTMVKYKGNLESTGRHISEKDDGRIIKRDDELILLEKRNFFSLFCLDLEAQLVHVNLTQLTEIFEHLVSTQIRGHTEYLIVWDELKGIIEGMGKHASRKSNPSSPLSSISSLSGDHQLSTSPSKRGREPTTQSPFV